MIRVRFPDDIVLQATFSSAAPVSAVLQWVEGALREPGTPFELAIARGQPLGEMSATLEHAELAPAAMLNFRCTSPGGVSPPYLAEDRMARVQLMGEESIPRGVGGEPHTTAMGAADVAGARPSRGADGRAAPAWMRSQ